MAWSYEVIYMAICQGQITAMIWAFFALKNCEEFEKELDKAQELSGSFAVQFEGGGGLWKQHGTESQDTDDFFVGVHESGGDISVCFNNGIIETVCVLNDFLYLVKNCIWQPSHITSKKGSLVYTNGGFRK